MVRTYFFTKKGSVILTPRIDNQTDKTQSVATELVIKENTVDKKIVQATSCFYLYRYQSATNLPDQIRQNLIRACLVR